MAEQEKPTFAKGDRVMLIRDLPAYLALSGIVPTGEALPKGTKGYIFGLDASRVFYPLAIRFETGTLWLCSFELVERYCAKAIAVQ